MVLGSPPTLNLLVGGRGVFRGLGPFSFFYHCLGGRRLPFLVGLVATFPIPFFLGPHFGWVSQHSSH